MASGETKVAILCSGLGNVRRGHEVFIRQVYDQLRGSAEGEALDLWLFKGAGPSSEREVVVPHLPRYAEALAGMRVVAAPKWAKAVEEDLRYELETTTFAYGALPILLEQDFDVIHCLEREVADLLYRHRLLFRRIPRFVFSNGGALPRARLPQCDLVQEHTDYALQRGATEKSVLLPHGVDLLRFDPTLDGAAFRAAHGIPAGALVLITVGTVCYWHKRMDHVIEEAALLDGAYLLVVGQRSVDAPAIEQLGAERLGDRVRFLTMDHAALPEAYAAADVFVLGSLFETFGIVYLEAMAMALPVVATQHENQRAIIGDCGVFVDMTARGAVADAVRQLTPDRRAELGRLGRARVEQVYDLTAQRQAYVDMYARAAAIEPVVPSYTWRDKLRKLLPFRS